MNSIEAILSRAIELATKEQLLQNLANYQPFFVENEQITKDVGREALLTHLHKQVLLPNRGVLDELTGSPAKKLTDTSISSVLSHLSGGTSKDDYNLFSHRLINEFAEQFFPEVLEESKKKKQASLTVSVDMETQSILTALNESVTKLDDNNPDKEQLRRAVEALKDIYEKCDAMRSTTTTQVTNS